MHKTLSFCLSVVKKSVRDTYLGELVEALGGAAADLYAGPEPLGAHHGGARIPERIVRDDSAQRRGLARGRHAAGGRGRVRVRLLASQTGHGAHLLVVDHDVRAQRVAEVGERAAAVLQRDLAHVLRLLLGEAVEGDVQRVQGLQLELPQLAGRGIREALVDSRRLTGDP